MPFDLDAWREECAVNQKLPCSRDGCEALRTTTWKVCRAHVDEILEKRSEASRKAVATRRARYPNRFKQPGARPEFRFQAFCHAAVNRAVKAGVLPDLSCGEYACSDCGGVASEYDHRDYARPLDVDPVCRSCNCKRGAAVYPSADRYQFPKLVDARKAKAA